MKFSAAALAIVLAGSCSSGDAVSILKPEITFVQLSGPVEQNYPQGNFEVQYGVRITNRSAEPIILRQIELHPMSAGGPYVVKAESYHFEREIPPAATQDVLFWAKVTSTGDQFSDDARAPVNIRATAHFDAKSGAFRQVFTKMLSQTGGRLGNR